MSEHEYKGQNEKPFTSHFESSNGVNGLVALGACVFSYFLGTCNEAKDNKQVLASANYVTRTTVVNDTLESFKLDTTAIMLPYNKKVAEWSRQYAPKPQ